MTIAGVRPPPKMPPAQISFGLSGNGPAGRNGESQQPLTSAQSSCAPCVPSKSDSSATTKITEFPVHAFELMIIETVDESHASAFAFSDSSFASPGALLNGHGLPSPGAIVAETPPCMSWHWLGTIRLKLATLLLARSPAKSVNGLMFARRLGLFMMSSKCTNGLCLLA